jgi:hypothetical protein
MLVSTAGKENAMSANPPQAATVNCPACRAQYTVRVQNVVDVSREPRLKSLLLQGRLNVGVCPQCGTGGMLSVPLVYHDPDKELLFCLIPQELSISESERQRLIGQMSNGIMSSLPPDRRKGYLLQPRPFLTFSTLLEAVLEADGITKAMLDQQRAKAQAISEMSKAVDDPLGLAAVLGQYEELIDYEFFALLSANIRGAELAGDGETAERLGHLRETLLERTPAGKEVAEQEKAVAEVLEGIDENLTRQDLLERITKIEGEHTEQILSVLIAVARPLVDYQFFQLLTERIDQAGQAGDLAASGKLKELRKQILELTQQLDVEARERAREKAQLLSDILQSQDRREAVRQNLQEIDSSFISVLEANIAQSEQEQRHDVADQLRTIRSLISEILQESAPPAVRLINRLLAAESPDRTRQMLQENRAMIDAEFIGMLDMLAQNFADRGEETTSDQLKMIKAQAELLS